MNRQLPPLPKRRTMKKLLCIAVLFLLGVPYGKGQHLEISLTNGPNLCCGYGRDNLACVLVTKMPPLGTAGDPILVYTWYARHEKGLKIWHTPVPGRWIPLPWAGTYEVWVVLQYVDPHRRNVYAAFRSNSVSFTAHNCEAPKPIEGKPND